MTNSRNINAEVVIRFPFPNVIDSETLERVFGNDLRKCVEELIFEEGIHGLIDNYEILSVEEIKN